MEPTSIERLEVSIQYIPYRIKTKGYKAENIVHNDLMHWTCRYWTTSRMGERMGRTYGKFAIFDNH